MPCASWVHLEKTERLGAGIGAGDGKHELLQAVVSIRRRESLAGRVVVEHLVGKGVAACAEVQVRRRFGCGGIDLALDVFRVRTHETIQAGRLLMPSCRDGDSRKGA